MVFYVDYIDVLNGIACVLNQGFKRNLSIVLVTFVLDNMIRTSVTLQYLLRPWLCLL